MKKLLKVLFNTLVGIGIIVGAIFMILTLVSIAVLWAVELVRPHRDIALAVILYGFFAGIISMLVKAGYDIGKELFK